METKTVQIIQPKTAHVLNESSTIQPKKQVCAYVRVSTDTIDQKSSYEAQRDEYAKRIQNNDEWIFSGIYADEGISGTSTKNRKQFNLMIEKAKNGEIDIILTKSISRFARNTLDALNYIRMLRKQNIKVFFEKENINSLDPKVEFLLTIMSSIAQEEARNTSENVKWSIKKKFREGIPVINTKRFLGYTMDKSTGNLKVVPEEAKIVKMIFNLYISGAGPTSICRMLMDKGIKTGAGKSEWRQSTLTSILTNEKYTGDMIQQKTISIDYLTHQRVKNKNHAPTYYTENNHEAIVDKETFKLAQRIRKERSKVKIGDDKNLGKYNRRYPLSAMIVCSQCGRTLKRRYWNYGKPSQRVMQQCGSYINGKDKCTAKASYQEIIEGATIEMLNQVFVKNLDVVTTIKQAIKETIKIPDTESKINKLQKEKEDLESAVSNLLDERLRNSRFSDNIFNAKYDEYTNRIEQIAIEISNLEIDYVKTYDTTNRIHQIEEFLDEKEHRLTELDSTILRSIIFKMISVSPSEMVYCIAGTKNYTMAEFVKKRAEFIKYDPIAEGTYLSEKYNKKMHYKVVVI